MEPEKVLALPQKTITDAEMVVKVFKGIVQRKLKPVIINNEQYLEYEDWQTLGEFYRYGIITGEAIPIEIDGIKGAKAHAKLVNLDTGLIVGGAEAYCMRDEERWDKKPWFQLASMAQTRAGAKAFRNRLAWVAVLAGYRPTPAEEMVSNEPEHWCEEHNCAFREYRKDNKIWYSHKTAEGEWCNESKKLKELPAKVDDTVIVSVKGSVPTEEKAKAPTEIKAEAKPEAKPESKDFLPENVGQMLWFAGTKGKSRTDVLAFLGETDFLPSPSGGIKVDVAWPKVKKWLEKGV